MINHRTTGVFTIAPTPFEAGGQLDLQSIDRLVEGYGSAGCSGITALGILGEAQKLEWDESLAVARRFIQRAGAMDVVIGVSASGFATMKRLAHDVMDMGAAGVMVAPSPSLRTDDQIRGYFSQVQNVLGPQVPWVLQDYPLALGVIMSPTTIRDIVQTCESCVMLKHEDWPGLRKLSDLQGYQASEDMRPISILVGNGGMFLDLEMQRGANGAMTGYAFPELLVDVVHLSQAGDYSAAFRLFQAHLPLMRYEQQPGVGLAIRKHLLQRRGWIASAEQRSPGISLDDQVVREIDFLLAQVSHVDPRVSSFL